MSAGVLSKPLDFIPDAPAQDEAKSRGGDPGAARRLSGTCLGPRLQAGSSAAGRAAGAGAAALGRAPASPGERAAAPPWARAASAPGLSSRDSGCGRCRCGTAGGLVGTGSEAKGEAGVGAGDWGSNLYSCAHSPLIQERGALDSCSRRIG
jgi:hypothetical protein